MLLYRFLVVSWKLLQRTDEAPIFDLKEPSSSPRGGIIFDEYFDVG